MNSPIQDINTACPYCARPKLFEPREGGLRSGPAGGALVHLSGKYWQRNFEERFPSVRSFPEVLFEDGERRFKIKGAKNFTPTYQDFDVEVIGLEFPFKLEGAAGPGFHRHGPRNLKPGDIVRTYAACRITHQGTGVKADAHFWPTHGLLVKVHHLPQNPTGEAIEAARTLFAFFTVEYRGTPKITPDRIMDAFEKLGAEATQSAVARELGVTRQALQMWGNREGKPTWEDMRQNYAPVPAM